MNARLAAWGVAFALGASLAAAQVPPPATLSDKDWREIGSVIESQRAALVAGEADRAFSYASPGIRRQFGDSRVFLAMVRQTYAALLDARDATLLEGAVVDGQVIQPMRLVLPDDSVRVALYTMERATGGMWKISGCVIAASTLRAT